MLGATPTRPPGDSRAASSSSSRSPARCSSRAAAAAARRAVARPRADLVDLVFDTLAELRDEGVTILLVEQNAARDGRARRPHLRAAHRRGSRSRATRDELQPRARTRDRVPRASRRRGLDDQFVQNVDRRPQLGSLYALLRPRHRPDLRDHGADQLRPRRADHGRRPTRSSSSGTRRWPILVLATLAIVVVLALAIERVAFRPVRDADPTTLLVTSFARQLPAAEPRAGDLRARCPRRRTSRPASRESFEVGGVTIPKLDVVTVGVTVVLLAALGAVPRQDAARRPDARGGGGLPHGPGARRAREHA